MGPGPLFRSFSIFYRVRKYGPRRERVQTISNSVDFNGCRPELFPALSNPAKTDNGRAYIGAPGVCLFFG